MKIGWLEDIIALSFLVLSDKDLQIVASIMISNSMKIISLFQDLAAAIANRIENICVRVQKLFVCVCLFHQRDTVLCGHDLEVLRNRENLH